MNEREPYKVAIQGDLPYNMKRMWQGAVGVAPVDRLVSPAYPRPDVSGQYHSHPFLTDAGKGKFDRAFRGIVIDRD